MISGTFREGEGSGQCGGAGRAAHESVSEEFSLRLAIVACGALMVPCGALHSSRLSGKLRGSGARWFQLALRDHKLLLRHSKGAFSQVCFSFVRCGP